MIQHDPQFEEFESMVMGLRAGIKLIKNYITGFDGHFPPCNTIEKIISKWAPPTENATSSYVNFVATQTGIHKNQIIWFNRRNDIVAIVHAMAKMETGADIDPKLIESAYDLLR